MTTSTTAMTLTWIGITEMTIEVIGKGPPQRYTALCTDSSCRAELAFTQDDIKYNSTYSMGRECGSYEDIVCPLCNQVLKKEHFKKVSS